jgi:hypothetical protein
MQRSAVAAGFLVVSVAALGGCTDSPAPDAAPNVSPSYRETSSPSSGPDAGDAPSGTAAEEPDAEALLSDAQEALRGADAVRISSQSFLVQGDKTTTGRYHAVWSDDPAAWIAGFTLKPPSGSAVKAYKPEWRYLGGTVSMRVTMGSDAPGKWFEIRGGFTPATQLPGVGRGNTADYPVHVVMQAVAVDAVSTADGSIIKAEVPNTVADMWFGANDFLISNGLPGVLEGGTTEISIRVDDSGFPTTVNYTGDDMEFTSEVPEYMQQNLAASQVTVYYSPNDLPRNLQQSS